MGGNNSTTGGYISSDGGLLVDDAGNYIQSDSGAGFVTDATPQDDDALDAIFQSLVVGITGLPGTVVFPRWQVNPPKQPERNVDWCAIGVMLSTTDGTPSITHNPNGGQGNVGSDVFVDHEELEVLASFYGPYAKLYAATLRDGIKVPQNTEGLALVNIRWVECGPIRPVPELFNQQWIHRQDMALVFRRKVTRNYPIENLLSGVVTLRDDTAVNDTIIVPPGAIVEP
jgi:hypothetical protein